MAVHVNEYSKAFRISRGDTFAFEVKLFDENDPPHVFSNSDYAVLKIRDRRGVLLYETYGPIENNAFPFTMTTEQSATLPPGHHFYDFALFINAVLGDSDYPIDAEQVVTPFFHPAEFHIEETVNHA